LRRAKFFFFWNARVLDARTAAAVAAPFGGRLAAPPQHTRALPHTLF
jgi:hypothetical protein